MPVGGPEVWREAVPAASQLGFARKQTTPPPPGQAQLNQFKLGRARFKLEREGESTRPPGARRRVQARRWAQLARGGRAPLAIWVQLESAK